MNEWLFLHEQQLEEINSNIGAVDSKADEAKTIARHAEQTSGSAVVTAQSAQVTAQDAREKAQNALNTARIANTKAEEAISTAQSVRSVAEEAITEAGEAKTQAEEADTKADSIQALVDAIEATVASLNTAVEALNVAVEGKQDLLEAGAGIGIENNIITNTKPNVWGVDQEFGGVYFPGTLTPVKVGTNDILLSELTGFEVASNRNVSVIGGIGVNLKVQAVPEATRFEVSNTFQNRFICASARNGYATISQATAGTICVRVTKVHTANSEDDLIPYSGPTESRNNIIIETDAPISETETLTQIRLYGTATFDTTFQCGQGVGTGGVTGQGKLLQLGQGQLSLAGNSIIVGPYHFNGNNRSAIFGGLMINHKLGALLAGQGHDTTDGKDFVTALGNYSSVGPNTAMAIGNGTSNTVRSNIFEVIDEEGATGLMVKAPNGTTYKLSVDNDGNINITAI